MRSFLLLSFLVSVAVALDFVSTDGFFSYSPTTQGAWGEFQIGIGSGCSTKTGFGPVGPGSFTFTFPQPSTSFQWFGLPSTVAGKVTICFDGAIGSSCDTTSYFTPAIADPANPITSFYRKTGLSNAVHTVTVTNIADPSNGNQYGQITVDKVVLDGSTRALPFFLADTFLSELTVVQGGNGVVLQNPLVGSGSPGMVVLMDTGASGSWFFWSGCTDPNCTNHPSYTPSSAAFNFSIVDSEFYTLNGLEYDSWRMNDTLLFGNISTQATFGATFRVPGSQGLDGNMGFAKTCFVGGPCSGTYIGFVEGAYLNGAIKAPVAAYYLDQTSGEGVVQVGGIDRNKYTGAIDWIPMDNDSKWRSPKQHRTIKASPTAASFNATEYFPSDGFIFDTGFSGYLWIPHNDFLMLVGLASGIDSSGQGTWEFPCDSTMTFNFLGSQGISYTIPLADKSSPGTVSGYCWALAQDGQGSSDWLAGTGFFNNYYMILHYESNMLGFATKNTGPTAQTSAILIGQA